VFLVSNHHVYVSSHTTDKLLLVSGGRFKLTNNAVCGTAISLNTTFSAEITNNKVALHLILISDSK